MVQQALRWNTCLTLACRSMSSSAVTAVALAAEELARWGITLEKRPEGEKVESLSTDSLGLNIYESERPSEEEACRTGDIRFFPQGGR